MFASWSGRPAASALLAAAEEPDRGFNAVVVGEYERAFYVDQFRQVVARLNAAGVEVWLPEAGGPVELDSPVHEALMVLLGAQAQREVVRAASGAGGDAGAGAGAGPVPGWSSAVRVPPRRCWPAPERRPRTVGRRLHVLEPDPVTAPWVEWIFTERARGRSVASLVRELNDRSVPCPSSADPGRNGHRSGERWIVRTVAMILENPQYTGRQVCNQQSTQREISEHLTHRPLVDDGTFPAVQETRTARTTQDGETRQYDLMSSGLARSRVDPRRIRWRFSVIDGYRSRTHQRQETPARSSEGDHFCSKSSRPDGAGFGLDNER